ncbi:PA2169 family four-helix-bundle protein [Terrimonas rubra]|uniref:PA2169 family four-helix-bundle protein n=1 Tax=Terrimonas rubra TaxID=1035890 RepID=A0ABW6A7P3_9BACT
MAHEACIEALNDLIQINNDRIAGYEKAIDELGDNLDGDLKILFTKMIAESGKYKADLAAMVASYGGKVAEGSTLAGKLYRAWMDVKAVFTGGDRKTVLSNCEAGEDAAQRAYQMALNDEEVMPETKVLIAKQKQELLSSHNEIKALRDAAR